MRIVLFCALLIASAFLLPLHAAADDGDMAQRGAQPATGTEYTDPGTAAPTAAPPKVEAKAHSASRIEERFFASATLGRTMHYYAYLPAGYDDDPTVRYPVVYLLHGMGGNADEWLGYGAGAAADDLMGSGAIHPYIIAFPHGEQGYWVNQVDNGPQWATYVVNDVVPEIDSKYRTLADRADRAIGGLSMGAHGALQISMNHPSVFGIIGAHSPSFRLRADVPSYFGNDAEYAERDPIQLIAAHPEIARTFIIWLDHGTLDGFRDGQQILEQELVDLAIPHQFHIWEGDHSGVYWNQHMGDYLRFYSASFAYASAGTH